MKPPLWPLYKMEEYRDRGGHLIIRIETSDAIGSHVDTTLFKEGGLEEGTVPWQSYLDYTRSQLYKRVEENMKRREEGHGEVGWR